MSIQFDSTPIKRIERFSIYIAKDGRVMMYLGKTSLKNWFYVFGSINYHQIGGTYIGAAYVQGFELNSKWEYESMLGLINVMLNKPAVIHCLHQMSGIPTLYKKLDLDVSGVATNWVNKNMIYDFFPRVGEVKSKKSGEVVSDGIHPVRSKDLVIGRVYVGSVSNLGESIEGWRSTFIYCGRNADKSYRWLFVGTPKDVIDGSWGKYIHNGVEVTKSNKKVYDPVYFPSDLSVDVSAIRHLIK